jgi:rsbT co-antagonist protein RsbR
MKVEVSSARIDRLMEALACASVEAFDAPEVTIGAQVEDEFGMLEHSFGVFLAELSEAKRTRELMAQQERVLEEQRNTIRELSVPIIDLWDGVLTLPVVGVIDTQRAVDMTQMLLARIVSSGALAVILDLTGVEIVDTTTAAHIANLARAARLVGARCVVTGIGPTIAQTLVAIGVDLAELETHRTLRDGLERCVRDAERAKAKANGGVSDRGGARRGS